MHCRLSHENLPFRLFLTEPKGIKAREVIDIGVHTGTPQLYDAFPEAHFYLVDPQNDAEQILETAPKKYSFLNVAVGARPGKLLFKESGEKSSFLERTSLTAESNFVERKVNVLTLDQIIDCKCTSNEIGVKIDSEGYEIEILHGLVENLSRISFIIAEISVRKRFVGGYNFNEAILAFESKGFALFNILNSPRPYGPKYFDVIFLKKDHIAFS